jgi:hypothetical protein
MTTNLGYARNDTTARIVEIISVDGPARKAVGRTREGSDIQIDCRHPVGAVMVTPGVGEVWWSERVGTVYTLRYRIPANSPDLLLEGVEGQVLIGSSGPTEIRGSATHVHSGLAVDDDISAGGDLTVSGDIVLGGARYRDADGTLERQGAGTDDWLPVAPPVVVRFVRDTATVGTTFVDRCYAPSRRIVGAYMRVSEGPVGDDLAVEIQHYTSSGWAAIATLTIADGATAEASETLDLSQGEGDYLRAEFLSVGSGTPAAGVVVDIVCR